MHRDALLILSSAAIGVAATVLLTRLSVQKQQPADPEPSSAETPPPPRGQRQASASDAAPRSAQRKAHEVLPSVEGATTRSCGPHAIATVLQGLTGVKTTWVAGESLV